MVCGRPLLLWHSNLVYGSCWKHSQKWEKHTLETINLLHWSHIEFFLKISSLCGEKYYTDLFLEENPAGVIQPPIIQTSWEIDFDQQGEGED